MSREELLVLAREVALRAYCPYSHFRVGTALVAGGELYTGVNVEVLVLLPRSRLPVLIQLPLRLFKSVHRAVPVANGWLTLLLTLLFTSMVSRKNSRWQIYCHMHSGCRGVAVAVATYALDNSHISCVRYKS